MKNETLIYPKYKYKTVFTLKSCNVEVHEDNYEHGEGNFVNSWNLKEYNGLRFKSLQAIINLVASEGIYNEDYTKPENWMLCGYDEDGIIRLDTDVLVNQDNYPADDNEIESWKKGEVKLYNAHYFVYVRCEYIKVVPKKDIVREAKDMGIDTDY